MAQQQDNGGKLIINLALIGAGYVLVVQPLLKKIGLDPAATALVAQIDNMDAYANPFEFSYINGDFKNGKGLTQEQFKNIWDLYDNDPNDPNIPASLRNAVTHATDIWNAFHGFPYNTFGNNSQRVSTIFSEILDKKEVSNIDALLISGSPTNLSLWSLLKEGHQFLPWLTFANNGLSDSHLATIVNHVLNLPADISQPQLK